MYNTQYNLIYTLTVNKIATLRIYLSLLKINQTENAEYYRKYLEIQISRNELNVNNQETEKQEEKKKGKRKRNRNDTEKKHKYIKSFK